MIRCWLAKNFREYLHDNREGAPIYTVEEVSDLLGIPRPTLYRYLREYSIPHLRRSGRISIPEESFERIREARDLHREGLGTDSVRRLLREGGNSGELKERLEQLSENVERLRSNERSADEALPSHALRTILARQNLLISAMFNLTEMVEELLLASGKSRKVVFDEVEGEIREVAPTPEEIPEGAGATPRVPPVRRARFGSLSRRRRRGSVAVLLALLAGLLLAWALPTLGSELASGHLFSEGREAESSQGPPDSAPEDKGAAQNPQAGDGTQDAGPSSGAGEPERVEVPNVSDKDVVEAKRILSRAGFEVAAIKMIKSPKEAGTVMRTNPSAAGPGESVVLVASGGPTGLPPALSSGVSAATIQYEN